MRGPGVARADQRFDRETGLHFGPTGPPPTPSSDMSKDAFVFLYLNMGSEMMYIIEQRLNAQNICKLRAQKGELLSP